jgi:hypothetical protein
MSSVPVVSDDRVRVALDRLLVEGVEDRHGRLSTGVAEVCSQRLERRSRAPDEMNLRTFASEGAADSSTDCAARTVDHCVLAFQ